MGILLGLIKATSGSICLFGDPVEGVRPDALRRIGAIVEEPSFYPYLSGRNNLRYFQGIGGTEGLENSFLWEGTWPKSSAEPASPYSSTGPLWALWQWRLAPLRLDGRRPSALYPKVVACLPAMVYPPDYLAKGRMDMGRGRPIAPLALDGAERETLEQWPAQNCPGVGPEGQNRSGLCRWPEQHWGGRRVAGMR